MGEGRDGGEAPLRTGASKTRPQAGASPPKVPSPSGGRLGRGKCRHPLPLDTARNRCSRPGQKILPILPIDVNSPRLRRQTSTATTSPSTRPTQAIFHYETPPGIRTTSRRSRALHSSDPHPPPHGANTNSPSANLKRTRRIRRRPRPPQPPRRHPENAHHPKPLKVNKLTFDRVRPQSQLLRPPLNDNPSFGYIVLRQHRLGSILCPATLHLSSRIWLPSNLRGCS